MKLKNLKYSCDNLSEQEIKEVVKEIKKSYSITAYKIRELKKLKVLKLHYNEYFIGCILFNEYREFLDLKIFIILEEYQNQKFGSKMLDYFLKNINKRPIFITSRNPKMIRLLIKHNFKKIKLLNTNKKYIFNEIKLIFSLYRIFAFIKKMNLSKSKFQFFVKYD